ncbi:C40 family peptidase [Costertonia aggregata]|uniref:C40 family peptidase n=1 Tax=Costertonia aggregata TaxID=343403 RepID=A0A7H9AQT5_9FLAO|nr:C40 family peptidase [Costertonia aggregata]QLG45800.1 C40 family peptidase [Costertonia aggregata]
MRKISCFFLVLFICSCGAIKKKTSYGKERKVTVEGTPEETSENDSTPKSPEGNISLNKADDIINTALTFSGTRYKFGGTTRKGMDCSGLLYVSFGEHDIALPRISYQMAEEGKRIKVNKVVKGDLLFFKTGKSRKRVNHVGLVVSVEDNDIKFIHASTSRGVIVSSLREGYWNYAFVKATRIL